MDLGGLQRVVNLLIKRLDRKYFEPHLCCLDRGGLFYEHLEREVDSKYILGRRQGPFDIAMLRRLIRVIRDNRIDIVHSNNGCTLYAAVAGKLTGVKGIIHTDHGRLIPDRPAAILEDRYSSYFIDRFVGVSSQLTEYLESVVKVRKKILTTIVNGVDSAKFIPLNNEERIVRRKNLGFNAAAKIIGTVCRLDPVKNLSMLIECIPEIVRTIPECQLIIVGDGTEEKRLKDIAHRLNISSRVIFVGRVADVETILSVFDLYVNTSVSEGTSMTILEAMSCGLPVVASAVGGNISLVDDSNGALYPSGASNIFAENVINILRDEDRMKQMGQRSRESVESRFSFGRVVEKYENLYRELMNN